MSASFTSPLTSQANAPRASVRPPAKALAKAASAERLDQARPKSFATQLNEARARDQAREQAQDSGRALDRAQDDQARADLFARDEGPQAPATDLALSADVQALEQARQSDARAFGFAELGVLGLGSSAEASAAPVSPSSDEAGPSAASPFEPSHAPEALFLAAAVSRAIDADRGAMSVAGPTSPLARAVARGAEPVQGLASVEPEAALAEAEVETAPDAPSAPAGTNTRQRPARAAASVVVAETDGQLHVLVGASTMSADDETRLRRGVEAAIAETGARPGEIHVNGRAARRPASPARQG